MSKELEALKKIRDKADLEFFISLDEDFEIIEKSLKALEIIKEKGNFINLEHVEDNDKFYIYDNEYYMRNEITKEEYELLKEILL
jgi:hypothetical protein